LAQNENLDVSERCEVQCGVHVRFWWINLGNLSLVLNETLKLSPVRL
jgi:hypothetical protein